MWLFNPFRPAATNCSIAERHATPGGAAKWLLTPHITRVICEATDLTDPHEIWTLVSRGRRQIHSAPGPVEIDATAVERADSMAVAAIVELVRTAWRRRLPVTVSASPAVRLAMEVCGVGPALGGVLLH